MDIQNLVKTYKERTDKYFLRSKQILAAEGMNPLVKYQIFARRDIESLVGVDDAVDFVRQASGNNVKICSLQLCPIFKSH